MDARCNAPPFGVLGGGADDIAAAAVSSMLVEKIVDTRGARVGVRGAGVGLAGTLDELGAKRIASAERPRLPARTAITVVEPLDASGERPSAEAEPGMW